MKREKRENRDRQLSVRVPDRLYRTLEKLAETERRTVANVVNNMLEDGCMVATKAQGRKR